jgi:hypothetical protein
MKEMTRLSMMVLMSLMLAGVAWAANEADADTQDQFGNPREPALQVFRTTGRGLEALVYHCGKSLKEGNQHFPILGSVKILEGFGTGLVELTTSTYKGMAGSKPKPHDELSKPNQVINSDPLLKNTRQVAGTAVVAGGGGIPAVAGLYAGQKVTDQFPKQEVEVKNGREREEKKRMTVSEAQIRYVGKRAQYGREVERGRGNLLKQFRYQEE